MCEYCSNYTIGAFYLKHRGTSPIDYNEYPLKVIFCPICGEQINYSEEEDKE